MRKLLFILFAMFSIATLANDTVGVNKFVQYEQSIKWVPSDIKASNIKPIVKETQSIGEIIGDNIEKFLSFFWYIFIVALLIWIALKLVGFVYIMATN